jgi:threonine 3-dehydrogenase
MTTLEQTARSASQTRVPLRGLLRGGLVNLEPIITHRFRLDEFEKAFQVMASGESGKVVLFP